MHDVIRLEVVQDLYSHRKLAAFQLKNSTPCTRQQFSLYTTKTSHIDKTEANAFDSTNEKVNNTLFSTT